jgi:hypothetical protein
MSQLPTLLAQPNWDRVQITSGLVASRCQEIVVEFLHPFEWKKSSVIHDIVDAIIVLVGIG